MSWWAGHRDGQTWGSISTKEKADGADPPLHPLIVSCSSQGKGQVAHTTLGKVIQKEQRMNRW